MEALGFGGVRTDGMALGRDSLGEDDKQGQALLGRLRFASGRRKNKGDGRVGLCARGRERVLAQVHDLNGFNFCFLIG